jgi:hypothetical protein
MGYPDPNLELSDYEGDDEFDERDWLLGSESSWSSDNGRGYWARLHSWVYSFFLMAAFRYPFFVFGEDLLSGR